MKAKRQPKTALTGGEIEAVVGLISQLHEHSISIATRTIYLGSESFSPDGGEGGTDARMAEVLMKNLHALENMSDEPATILMNNVGGDVYHGLAIYDAIRLSPLKITGVVRGHAMSMGSWILQACDRRVMGPTSTQMVHYGTDGFIGHSKDFRRRASEGERLNRLMEETYLGRIREKHPRFTLREMRKLLAHDTFLTAQQSVEVGLADAIG